MSRHTPRPGGRMLTRGVADTLLLTACVTVTACTAAEPARNATASDDGVPVRVSTLGATTTPISTGEIRVTGTLAGKEEVALAFRIGGVIERVTVDPGERVRAGQVLAALRPTEIAAQVASAQEAQRKAERDLARVSTLYADSVATLEQVQDARTGLNIAANALRVAQFNAAYAVIRAPGDGVVLARLAEPGQVLEPGRSVLTVRRDGRGMVVRVGLPDRDAVRVRLGDPATVAFDALRDQIFAGRVTERAAAASPGTGDYAAEITLAGAAGALPTGLVAHVTLQPQQAPVSRSGSTVTDIRVPLDALSDADADSAAVFVLAPDRRTVRRQPVRLRDVAEAFSTGSVPIVSGLSGTETIVIAGVSRLVHGARVSVIAPQADRPTASAEPAWRIAP